MNVIPDSGYPAPPDPWWRECDSCGGELSEYELTICDHCTERDNITSYLTAQGITSAQKHAEKIQDLIDRNIEQ